MKGLSSIQQLFPFFDETFLKDQLNAGVSLHHSDRAQLRELFSVATFDQMLNAHVFDRTDLQLYVDGRQVPPEEITNSRGHIDRHKVNSQVSKHSTSIKVNQAQRFSLNLAQLHTALSFYTRRRISMNLYYSPRETPCFSTHQDPYPLLVVQLFGSKKWRYKPETREANLTHEDFRSISDGVQFRDLQEGEVLHLPAQVIHDAQAEKGPSLHLTIGFIELTYTDLWNHVANDPQLKLIMARPLQYDGTQVDASELQRTMEAIWRRYFSGPSTQGLLDRWALDEARKNISHHEPFNFSLPPLASAELSTGRWVVDQEKVWMVSASPKGCSVDSIAGIARLPWSKNTMDKMFVPFETGAISEAGIDEAEIAEGLVQLHRMGLLKKSHG